MATADFIDAHARTAQASAQVQYVMCIPKEGTTHSLVMAEWEDVLSAGDAQVF